jgi:hypothetical protein
MGREYCRSCRSLSGASNTSLDCLATVANTVFVPYPVLSQVYLCNSIKMGPWDHGVSNAYQCFAPSRPAAESPARIEGNGGFEQVYHQ